MSIWKKQVVDAATKKSKKKGITKYRSMYTKDKKMIAKSAIPANVYKLLQEQEEVDDTNLNTSIPWRECVFCGAEARKSRFLDLQTVELCDEHYYGVSTGKVIQHLRELKEGVPNA